MPDLEFFFTDSAHHQIRLDVFLSERLPGLSRSRIQKIIKDGKALIDGNPRKPSYLLREGETVRISYEEEIPHELKAEEIPLEFLYRDAHVAVINKPSGMVVHPGAGVTCHTLVNALLFYFPDITKVGEKERPGLVHRLDKDTSGALVAALTEGAYQDLLRQFRQRKVTKEYSALVWGKMPGKEGIFDQPIGRHVKYGNRISVKTNKPRSATTLYEVKETFSDFTLLFLKPITGRTHQLRVHLSSSGHPIVGDVLYGRKKTACPRLFLHAFSLEFTHPHSGERVRFTAPLPPALQSFLSQLDKSGSIPQ